MSSRLQLDVHHVSLWRRHLVNAYKVKAGIGVIAGKTVWSMPERLVCSVLQKDRYINTLTFTFLWWRYCVCLCLTNLSLHRSSVVCLCGRFTDMECELSDGSTRLDEVSFTVKRRQCWAAATGEHRQTDYQPFADYIVVRIMCQHIFIRSLFWFTFSCYTTYKLRTSFVWWAVFLVYRPMLRFFQYWEVSVIVLFIYL